MLTTYPGGRALSDFRAAGLLARVQSVAPGVTGVTARFVHWVAGDTPPDPSTEAHLARLLTYGEPYAAPPAGDTATLIVVAPRLGTVSPWASKATDIAHTCGLSIHRVERVTEYHLHGAPLTAAQREACAQLLHDRMTESVLPTPEAAAALFEAREPEPMAHVEVLTRGREALEEADAAYGLSLIHI